MSQDILRDRLLDRWLEEALTTKEFVRFPLAGDASFRKYYRVQLKMAAPGISESSYTSGISGISDISGIADNWGTSNFSSTYIVMDAPPPETPDIFVKVAGFLQSQSVMVPKICAFDNENGFLLLSDFGDNLYSKSLNIQSAPTLYGEAIDALLKIQQCQGEVPKFDKAFMKKQLNVFKEWYLSKHLNLSLDAEILENLESLSEKLYSNIAEQPAVFVHQDYHSRNLMILEQGGPGILDFQDAVKGPITYDLVSLFQDAYIDWPREEVETWVSQYQTKALQAGILSRKVSLSDFLRWMDLTGLQRHLKNLGVFARLNYRDGKKQYLNDMPRLQQYIQSTYQRYPDLLPYGDLFDRVLSNFS